MYVNINYVNNNIITNKGLTPMVKQIQLQIKTSIAYAKSKEVIIWKCTNRTSFAINMPGACMFERLGRKSG